MKIFTAGQIRAIDKYTIENEPLLSVDLMERAALALYEWIIKKIPESTSLLLFAGPGNNGGDAWALARLLYHRGYENIRFYVLHSPKGLSPDSEINKTRLYDETNVPFHEINSEEDFPIITKNEWIIDGLFGTGISRPLDGIAYSLINYVNKSDKQGVVSIDMPSGLFAENNTTNNYQAIIKASYTLSFQFPKLAFMFVENGDFVGKWKILDIGLHNEIIQSEQTPYTYITKPDIKKLISSRQKFSHKGTYGHALIVAGCYGMMGAAILAAKAAVRSGAGLVTTHIPRLGCNVMQTAVPEAIVDLDESDILTTGVNSLDKYTALAIGPGIQCKQNTQKALKDLIAKVKIPLVLDADAINILSENKDWIDLLPKNTILTPHPKEFDRLTQQHDTGYERFESQCQLSKENNIIIVLKGAHTSITMPDGTVSFNSSGNPGMATGGSGDVLTGVIVALLAQGYKPNIAVSASVYIHGLAADLAIKKTSMHGLMASDIIDYLCKAFLKLEC